MVFSCAYVKCSMLHKEDVCTARGRCTRVLASTHQSLTLGLERNMAESTKFTVPKLIRQMRRFPVEFRMGVTLVCHRVLG
jgi:hypothetical protein